MFKFDSFFFFSPSCVSTDLIQNSGTLPSGFLFASIRREDAFPERKLWGLLVVFTGPFKVSVLNRVL